MVDVELEREEFRIREAILRRADDLATLVHNCAIGEDEGRMTPLRFQAAVYLLNKVISDPPRRTELTGRGGGPLQVIAPLEKPNLDLEI